MGIYDEYYGNQDNPWPRLAAPFAGDFLYGMNSPVSPRPIERWVNEEARYSPFYRVKFPGIGQKQVVYGNPNTGYFANMGGRNVEVPVPFRNNGVYSSTVGGRAGLLAGFRNAARNIASPSGFGRIAQVQAFSQYDQMTNATTMAGQARARSEFAGTMAGAVAFQAGMPLVQAGSKFGPWGAAAGFVGALGFSAFAGSNASAYTNRFMSPAERQSMYREQKLVGMDRQYASQMQNYGGFNITPSVGTAVTQFFGGVAQGASTAGDFVLGANNPLLVAARNVIPMVDKWMINDIQTEFHTQLRNQIGVAQGRNKVEALSMGYAQYLRNIGNPNFNAKKELARLADTQNIIRGSIYGESRQMGLSSKQANAMIGMFDQYNSKLIGGGMVQQAKSNVQGQMKVIHQEQMAQIRNAYQSQGLPLAPQIKTGDIWVTPKNSLGQVNGAPYKTRDIGYDAINWVTKNVYNPAAQWVNKTFYGDQQTRERKIQNAQKQYVQQIQRGPLNAFEKFMTSAGLGGMVGVKQQILPGGKTLFVPDKYFGLKNQLRSIDLVQQLSTRRGGNVSRGGSSGGMRVAFNMRGGGGGHYRNNFAAYQKLFAARQAQIEAEKARRNDLNLASAQYWEASSAIPEAKYQPLGFNYHAYQRDLVNPELEGETAHYDSITRSTQKQLDRNQSRFTYDMQELDRKLSSNTKEYKTGLSKMGKYKNTPEGKIEIAQLNARYNSVVNEIQSRRDTIKQQLSDLSEDIKDNEDAAKKDIGENAAIKSKEFTYGQKLFTFADQRDLIQAKRSHLLSRVQQKAIKPYDYMTQEYQLQRESLGIEFSETQLKLDRDKETLGKMAEGFGADRYVSPEESDRYKAATQAYEQRVSTFQNVKKQSYGMLSKAQMTKDLGQLYGQAVKPYVTPYVSAFSNAVMTGNFKQLPMQLLQTAGGQITQWAGNQVSNWIGNQYANYKVNGGQGVGGFIGQMFGMGGGASVMTPGASAPRIGVSSRAALAGGRGFSLGNMFSSPGAKMAGVGLGLGLMAGGSALYGSGSTAGKIGGMAMGIGGGALSGAMLGSFAGPVGTAIGAVAGAIVGAVSSIFGGKKKQQQEAMQKRHEYQDSKLAPFLNKLVSKADPYDLDDLNYRMKQASRGMKANGSRGMAMKTEALTRLRDIYTAVLPFESTLRYAGKFEGKQFDVQVAQNASIAAVNPRQSKPFSDLFDSYSTLQEKLANTYPVFSEFTPEAQKTENMNQFGSRITQTKELFTKVYNNQRSQIADQITYDTAQLGFQQRSNSINALSRGISTDTMNRQYQNFDRDSRIELERALGTLQRPNNRAAIVKQLQEEQSFNKNILTRQRELLGLNNSLSSDQDQFNITDAQKSLSDLSASQDILDQKYQVLLSTLGDVNDEFFKITKELRDFNEALRKL